MKEAVRRNAPIIPVLLSSRIVARVKTRTNCVGRGSAGPAFRRLADASAGGKAIVSLMVLAAAMALVSVTTLRAHHSFPSYYFEEQMVTILREADARPVPEVAKKHGVSAQTIYGWRKHFGTLEPADVKRLRQLEQENGRLKKMVADRELEIDVLKEITRKKW